MNVTAIIFAAVVVGGVGILIGFFLGVSGEKFKVEVDEREVAVTEALPGNNCVCRDVLKEIHASFIQELGCVLTTDHNKLCRIRCCTYKRYQRI